MEPGKGMELGEEMELGWGNGAGHGRWSHHGEWSWAGSREAAFGHEAATGKGRVEMEPCWGLQHSREPWGMFTPCCMRSRQGTPGIYCCQTT